MCIRDRGNGVWNLTTMFLTTWNAYKHQDQSYVQYRPTFTPKDTLLKDVYKRQVLLFKILKQNKHIHKKCHIIQML